MAERKPTEDLKDGLLLLVRAARGLSKQASAETLEKGIQTGAKELVRVINNVGRVIGSELEKAAGSEEAAPAGKEAPPAASAGTPEKATGEPPKKEPDSPS